MLKIPASDGNTYSVPSWTQYRRWLRRFGLAYLILALACAVGIYAYGQKNKKDIINSINSYSSVACRTVSRSFAIKHNDLVDAIIAARITQLEINTASGSKIRVAADKEAIRKYKKDFLTIPTDAQCAKKILK